MSLRARLRALEGSTCSKMIVAKLPADGDLDALLTSAGIVRLPTDLLVRIDRPEGCGRDFARLVSA